MCFSRVLFKKESIFSINFFSNALYTYKYSYVYMNSVNTNLHATNLS